MVTMQDLFKFEQTGLDAAGKTEGRFVCVGVRPAFLDRFKSRGIDLDPAMFERRVMPVDKSSEN